MKKKISTAPNDDKEKNLGQRCRYQTCLRTRSDKERGEIGERPAHLYLPLYSRSNSHKKNGTCVIWNEYQEDIGNTEDVPVSALSALYHRCAIVTLPANAIHILALGDLGAGGFEFGSRFLIFLLRMSSHFVGTVSATLWLCRLFYWCRRRWWCRAQGCSCSCRTRAHRRRKASLTRYLGV